MRAVTDYLDKLGPGGAEALQKSHVTSDVSVPKSWFTDPFALLDSLGLGYRTSPSGVSYDTLKQMAEHNVIIAAIVQTRVHQVSSFNIPQPNKYSVGFKLSHRDPNRRLTEGEINFIKELEFFLLDCGRTYSEDREDFDTYVKKLVRDRMYYDQMCTEVVSQYNGKPHSFFAIPASTIRLASPKKRKGTPLTPAETEHEAKYVQIVDGTIVNTYTAKELAFSVANPRTDLRSWGYGYSELEMLIKTVTSHLWAEEWNRRAFSQGSTAKGLLNIKGNLPPQQFEAFKRQWLTQISGVSNAWRTPVINSNDDIQWISLQPTNSEMGYQQWMEYLIKIACAIFLIDPSEINFDIRAGAQKPVFMGTNEAQQKLSQDRGLRPLLRHIQSHINRHIIRRIDPNYQFEYVGVDAKTEAEAIELRLKELSAYKTLNEIRELEQLPPVAHGDIVPNPSYIGYRNQKELAAQQQGGGMPGMPGMPQSSAPSMGDEPPGRVERDAARGILKKVGDKPDGGGRVADRHNPEPSEDWENTITASVQDDDLKKAAEPYHALLVGT